MENVTQLKPRIKHKVTRITSDSIVKIRPSGGFSIGRSQPPKNDRHYKPLQGITSNLDFRGAKIDRSVVVVKDGYGIHKVFKQNNISVVQTDEVATVYQTSEVNGVKVSKVIDVIQQGKELKGYYITKADILVRPVKKISIESVQPEYDPDPVKLERIALDYEKAGNHEMAKFFSDRYAKAVLNPNQSFENLDYLLVEGDDLAVSPLGLSDAINCHKSISNQREKALKRGSKGITVKQRHRVTEGCYLLEENYGRHCLSFLTATLPAFCDRHDLELICANWSDLIRKFIQELKRELDRRGYPTDMVWVTEIQEDRYINTGVVAPHLHLTMVGKKHRYAKNWAISKAKVRSLWETQLSNLLGRPVTCEAATRVERPRKSLKAEMGKYMSKGGKIIKQIIEDGKGDQLPTNYGGCSDELRKEIDSKTKVLKGIEALKFEDNLEEMKQAGLLFYKPIIIYAPNLGRDLTVGFVGWIKNTEVVSQFLAA